MRDNIKYKKKLNKLIYLVDITIQKRKIDYFKLEFPIGSYVYAHGVKFVVGEIFCNSCISSEHHPDFNLDRHYSIRPESGYNLLITNCESQKERRLNKLKRILD